MSAYSTCDHPDLMVKDNLCFMCEELDGQTDALNEVSK